jgi:RNA polymerase sigma-70 factor (ECF subfamily)
MKDFHRLIIEQIPRLRRYARALVRDGARADDLVQDTLTRAIAKEHLWQPGTSISAWLFTLMHNHNVNTVRRSLREGTTVDVERYSATLIGNTDPEASWKLRELDRAMARLLVEQRQALLLVGLEGLRYQDAASVLGIPVGTVRSRVSRARTTLRYLLDITEKAGAPAAMVPRREQPKAFTVQSNGTRAQTGTGFQRGRGVVSPLNATAFDATPVSSAPGTLFTGKQASSRG